jgi:hypothetical protein
MLSRVIVAQLKHAVNKKALLPVKATRLVMKGS